MSEVVVKLNALNQIGTVSPYLFGSFVEHMGRCVYGGIFDPSDPSADEHGFRKDVLELTRELGVTLIRYPGGNFVSGYQWEDGIGPVENRPTRLDLAWRSIEPNTFGLNEFMAWAKKAGVEPMMAMNLGTRGVLEAAQLVEYANYPADTAYADLRREHGVENPHGIKYWCLGNEMDGPWQIGHKTAEDYGKLASEAAKAIRLVDPDVRLVACGSSFEEMPTFGEWESTVLDHSFDHVEMISMHAYYEKFGDDSLSFLASSARMDRFIKGVIDRADAAAKKRGSDKQINISFDEWNVWYQKRFEGVNNLTFRKAPRLIEDEYTVEDAVVVGSLMMTLIKHANRVEVAAMAQLVNVIGPIRTEPGAPAWRQTIFHPFALTANNAKGTVLDLEIEVETKDAELFKDLPLADAVATFDEETNSLVLFLLNRNTEQSSSFKLDLSAVGALEFVEGKMLGGENLDLTNNLENPNRVQPADISPASVHDSVVEIELPKISWSMLKFKVNG